MTTAMKSADVLQPNLTSAVLAFLVLSGIGVAAPPAALYEQNVKPLLRTKCVSCHGPLKQEAGLRLDTADLIRQGGDGGPVVDLAAVATSELLRRVSTTELTERMPPEGEPLTSEQVSQLHQWLDSGALAPVGEVPLADPRSHWSFQPVATTFSSNSIDEFIEQRLTAARLTRAPRADRVTLIRRLHLDLLGLPPTPAQVAAFVQDESPEAWPRLVDEALASPRYGERWAQHWLDVVRYADTHGFEVNTPRDNAWPYRDYVIRAFNEDKPYNQFVREQLAGDVLQADAATGFLVAAAVLLPGQIGQDEESKRLARQDALDEIIVGTSGTFLGLTIGCARCHDHKFDPIAQRDYYALQAFFAGVDYGDRIIKDAGYEHRVAEAARLETELQAAEAKLDAFEPLAFTGHSIIIDDEDEEFVVSLKEKNGHGENPTGDASGFLEDEGTPQRTPNISQGRYTWWTNVPGEDVFTYQPKVEGWYRTWISWGAHGSGVHTRDARYLFDRDGDLATRDDQQEIARIDQYYLAGVTTGETEQTPLWSGLLYVGGLDWTVDSKLLLRGGETGTGITADAIVLQEAVSKTDHEGPQPYLRVPVNPLKNVERFPELQAKFVRFTSLETMDDNQHEPCLDELEVFASDDPVKNLALAELGAVATSSGNFSNRGKHQLKHIHDGQYGNDRSWISNELGRGWVQIELPQLASIERVVWGRDRLGELGDRLPIRYLIEVSENGSDWTLVASSDDRLPFETPYDSGSTRLRNASPEAIAELVPAVQQVADLRAEQQRLTQHSMVYGGLFREPDETFLLRRGDPEQPVEPVAPAYPGFLDVAHVEAATESQRRLALADWITQPEHPLTSRVLVNRVWQGHFGRGLVATPSDFGINGTLPSHPELLDWLATQFQKQGWSIKQLHRLILLSQTYQQSSQIDPVAAELDADCQLLWRFPARRLEGESVRDCMLLVSGQLNLKMYGPGFNLFKSRGGLSGFPAVEEFTANELRRMIYAHKVRMEQVPVFGAFDCPDAGQSMPKRSQSTTSIQALNLFNSPFVNEQARLFSESLITAHEDSPVAQVRAAFQLTMGRLPSATEEAAASDVVQQHGLQTLCRVLFNSSEFLFIP